MSADEEFVTCMTAVQPKLRAFILGLVGNPATADDVLQEVNLALWRKRGSYDCNQSFDGWAFGFASVEVRRHRSRQANERLWFNDETIEVLVDEWPRVNAFMDDCSRALAACLQKLGAAERDVIHAKYRRKKSVKEISESLNRPLSTVYKILHRALASLKSCIQSAHLQAEH